MEWAVILGFALLGLILVVGALFIANKVRDDDEEGDDVELAGDADPSVSVPIRTRAAALSTPGKIFVASLALMIVVLGIWLYFTVRAGTPAGAEYADRLLAVIVLFIGFTAGIVTIKQVEQRVGVLYNEYENDDGTTDVEQVEVDVVNTRTNNSGTLLLKQYADQKFLGLFRRFKVCGEDPRLHNRPPSKPVEHPVTGHATQVDDTRYHQRTQGREEQNSPYAEQEYTYKSPFEMSYSDYVDVQESKSRMRIRLQSLEKRLSVVTTELNKLERKLDSEEYNAEEEIMEMLERLQEMVQDGGDDHDEQGRPMTQMPFQLTPQSGQQQPATDGGEQ